MLVNLVGYNGYVITSGDVENVKYMVAAEHGAARIRRIVYNDRRCRLVDLRLEVVQIDLPTEVRLQTNESTLIGCIYGCPPPSSFLSHPLSFEFLSPSCRICNAIY